MKRHLGLLLLIQLLMAGPASAHPVSFKDAVSFMSWNQPFFTDLWATYSFRSDSAIAVRYMRMNMNEGKMKVAFPQFDYLLKRWNEPDYQANIYMYGGFGGAHFQDRYGNAGMVGAEADAESRKYFAMAGYEGMYPSLGPNFQHIEARLGIAPYEAEFTELATWLMVQAQYHPALIQKYSITPLARFFYKSVLWEMGVSLEGDWMFNFMFHF